MDLRKNLWVYKYSPTRMEDIILNEEIRPKLNKAFKELPNMLIYGTPGIGKGCFANIIKEKENVDYLWVNASDENGIDVFRNKIASFANAMCMPGKMKVVILNECDSLTSGPQGSQKLLRQLMEDTYKICRFILICNYDNYIIPEIKSRCQVIKFDNPPKKEIGKLCLKIMKREKIKFESLDLLNIIKKGFPDIRKIINVLQENSVDGKLIGSRMDSSEELFEKILNLILERDLEAIREELRSNYIPYEYLYEYLYENAGKFSQPGLAILEIGKHLHWNVTTSPREIVFIRMVVSLIYKKAI